MSHNPARWLFRIAALLAVGHLAACAQQNEDALADQGSHASPAGQSCENKCGGSSDDQSCYCDDECDTIGDCCSDYAAVCGNGTGSGGNGSGPGAGGSKATGGASSGGASSGGSGSGGSGGTSSGASCAGHCGGPSADGTCWCDNLCQKGGDCCTDAVSACGVTGTGGVSGVGGGGGIGGATGGAQSCVGHCGGPSADGSCWCDPTCSQTADCCADVATACGGTPTSGGCSPAICGSPNPGTENGAQCYCDMDCLMYGDCCSNVSVCGI